MAYEEIVDLINKHEHIGIITHIMPDGDTLGSALALGAALKDMDKRVTILNQDGVPIRYRFLVDDWVVPVSYTHLDVYKRQALNSKISDDVYERLKMELTADEK